MFQNMLLTTLTPLHVKNEANSWENRPFTTVWPENLQQKTKGVTRTIKKKQKRVRTAFSTDQIRILEKTFSNYRYLSTEKRGDLAKSLNITEKCVKVWFQNRRMKEKKESSESSNCDTSSESFENETSSVSTSPPLEIKPNEGTQALNQYFYKNSEYTYQLPTYHNLHQNMYGGHTSNVSSFYNDTNVYPTHYYPVETQFPGAEVNDFHNHYGSEMSHVWASTYNSYYPTI